MPPSSTPLDDVKDDHDDLVFLEEQAAASAGTGADAVWRVMIVDDDEDVHSTTTFALGNLDMQHRPLEFVHAYSAAQAREMLRARDRHRGHPARRRHGTGRRRPAPGALHPRNAETGRRAHHPAHRPARLRAGNRRHPRFRHQRLQDQVRTDPHQAVHHRDRGDPLVRADPRHQRQPARPRPDRARQHRADVAARREEFRLRRADPGRRHPRHRSGRRAVRARAGRRPRAPAAR